MKKFLIVAHYSRFLVQFELNDVRLLQLMGFEVHYATNYQQEDMFSGAIKIIQENGVILHQIDFVRSPYNIPANIKAYRQLKNLMVKEKFSGVHCHTPMAGALARLAANATGTKPVLYTAHGFHFYKGCPLKNKLIYQTAETFLARYTDAQITINREDFAAAQKFPALKRQPRPQKDRRVRSMGGGCVYSGLLRQKAASAVSSAAGPGRYCRCFQWSGNSR